MTMLCTRDASHAISPTMGQTMNDADRCPDVSDLLIDTISQLGETGDKHPHVIRCGVLRRLCSTPVNFMQISDGYEKSSAYICLWDITLMRARGDGQEIQ